MIIKRQNSTFTIFFQYFLHLIILKFGKLLFDSSNLLENSLDSLFLTLKCILFAIFIEFFYAFIKYFIQKIFSFIKIFILLLLFIFLLLIILNILFISNKNNKIIYD